jgi:hypothetical protein
MASQLCVELATTGDKWRCAAGAVRRELQQLVHGRQILRSGHRTRTQRTLSLETVDVASPWGT